MRNYFSRPSVSPSAPSSDKEVKSPPVGQLAEFEIVPFKSNLHRSSLISLLRELRENGDDYPPTYRIGDGSREALGEWLDSEDALISWVAIRDDEVIGFVSLAPTSDFIGDRVASRDNYLEVRRLFVRPIARQKGLGSELLEHALTEARNRNKWVCFSVAETLPRAMVFYAGQRRFICTASCTGTTVMNHIYVEKVTWREARQRFRESQFSS